MLVAGLVVGGWALILGFLALTVTGLGWLRDARREYAATAAADTTGHLDLGGAPAWPTATFAVLAILVAFALALSSGLLGPGDGGGAATASGAPGASAAPGGGGEASAPPASAAPAADVVITALNTAWVQAEVTIPAGGPFTLAFDNQDKGVPHDVVVKDGSGAITWQTELITGPKVVVYDVPAITAGQYTFICTVHPNMIGTLTAE
jgi:plastocyanin